MSEYSCTVCGQKERVKAELKRHLLSQHDRLRLVCVWCRGKELYYRKAVDLKQHVKDVHRQVYRDAPAECFGEPGCFYLAKYPSDYRRVIKPVAYSSEAARFLRKAVEEWHSSVREKTLQSLRQWKEGWSSVPLLSPSPSPTLDFGERPHLMQLSLHQLTIDSEEISAVIYEEFLSSLRWYKVKIDSSIRANSKMLHSLLRRLDQVKPFQGIVPVSICDQLEGEVLKIAKGRLSSILKIDTTFISCVWRKQDVPFSEDPESVQPPKKRSKITHSPGMSTPSECSTVQTSEEKPVLPLDVLLPKSMTLPTLKSVGLSGDFGKVAIPTACNTLSQSDVSSVVVSASTPSVAIMSTVPESISDVCSSTGKNDAISTPSEPTLPANVSTTETIPSPIQPYEKPSTVSYNPHKDVAVSTRSSVSTVTYGASSTESNTSATDKATFSAAYTATHHLCTVESSLSSNADAVTRVENHSQEAANSIDGKQNPFDWSGNSELVNAEHMQNNYQNVSRSTVIPGVNECGDHEYTVMEPDCPTYTPTPKLQPGPLDLSMRAENLLRFGCMPLLPPARRNWEEDEVIVLPARLPVPLWPPKKWSSYTADAKLLLWETTATALALQDGIDIDRGEILDTYNFLALPGTANPQFNTPLRLARYRNFEVLKSLRVGSCSQIKAGRDFLCQLEAVKDVSNPTIASAVLLEQIERKKINIRM